MIEVGKRVKVLDNYSGGLEGVIGKSGKVVEIRHGFYVLDIYGTRKPSWSPNRSYDYQALALENEIEELQFDLTDGKGNPIELGDVVAYGPLSGGVTLGKVIDIAPYDRGSAKFLLEVDGAASYSDGADRQVSVDKTYKQWYHSGNRALVIKKAKPAGFAGLRPVS